MKIGPRFKIVLALLAVVMLLAAWQGLRFWWYHGYSQGERTGIVRKLSVKGTPICRYAEGELALAGGQMGQNVEVFTFSVDNYSDANPIMKQMREAERAGSRVTLHYRQDLKSWWRCTPHEYFITSVEK
ncbi:MAG: hypothetical protein JWN44_729 [Myxococcales bacterium]|nr:hypothetical protein [Myxococcales bacterium]